MTVEAWSLWHGLCIKSGLISFPYSSLFVEGQGFPSYFAEIMQWKLFMEIFSEKEGLEFRHSFLHCLSTTSNTDFSEFPEGISSIIFLLQQGEVADLDYTQKRLQQLSVINLCVSSLLIFRFKTVYYFCTAIQSTAIHNPFKSTNVARENLEKLHSREYEVITRYPQSVFGVTVRSELLQLVHKAKYPDIVALPDGLWGDYIILRNPKVSGFELMIVWKIHLDEEGRTTPVLDLLTKVPEQVLEQNRATVENAPAHFRSLLLLLGAETAIENLIKALDLEK
ncbi:hypothetical protein Q9966_007115 [Columba livia]|nr:hypothetical protein Q9966_007115 [Columba livia]